MVCLFTIEFQTLHQSIKTERIVYIASLDQSYFFVDIDTDTTDDMRMVFIKTATKTSQGFFIYHSILVRTVVDRKDWTLNRAIEVKLP